MQSQRQPNPQQIGRAIDGSPSLRDKRDLIEAFVDQISASGAIDEEWQAFIANRRATELATIIADENLNAAATGTFIDSAFREGQPRVSGTAITAVMPPISRFTPDNVHAETKERVVAKIMAFFDRFYNLGGGLG